MRPYFLCLPLLLACAAEKTTDTAEVSNDDTEDSESDIDDDGGVDDGDAGGEEGTDDGDVGGDDDGDDGSDADGTEDGSADNDDNSADTTLEVVGTIDLLSGRVMDPKRMSDPTLPISVTQEGGESCETSIRFSNGIGQRRTLFTPEATTEWDGRDDDGVAYDPGEVSIKLRVRCGDDARVLDETTAYIVRLGPNIVDLTSAADAPGQVGLAFHKKSLLEAEVSPVGDRPEYKQEAVGVLGSAIDRDDGTPRPPVPLWTNAHVPPWADGEAKQHNVPTGYKATGAILARVEWDAVAVSQARRIAVSPWGPEPDKVPMIRLVANGTTVNLDEPMEVALGDAASTMGKHILTVDWQFESSGKEDDWHLVPGTFQTQHAYYVLAGDPALLDGSSVGASPAVPWIGVLEDTAELFEGIPATVEDTLDTLRDYLFNHDYLLYDPGSGSYSDFEGDYMYWSAITAEVSSFLDRREGLSLYCHSMSCMLSALAGSHGVRAEQIVLGVNFTTNLTRAAGSDSWRAWSFNSHSVVTPDDGATIWDASIALDGDDEPDDDESIEEVMPKGMSGEEYMWRLSYDDIGIINQGLCYIE